MEFNTEFWKTPEKWLAAIILDSEKNQTYGKIKNGYAILERVPKPESQFNYLDIVKINGPIGKQMYKDDEIEEYQAFEIVKKSELRTYSYEAILSRCAKSPDFEPSRCAKSPDFEPFLIKNKLCPAAQSLLTLSLS